MKVTLVNYTSVNFFQLILDRHFALLYTSSSSPITAILEDRSVTLMGLTSTHAYFAVTDEDVYNLNRFPFAYMAQAKHAKEVITMSLENFVKLGDVVQNKSKVLLLNNSSR